MAGLAAARPQGRTGGRPTVMDPGKLAAAQGRRASGESPTQIARAIGVSRASIYRHLAATPGMQQAFQELSRPAAYQAAKAMTALSGSVGRGPTTRLDDPGADTPSPPIKVAS